MIHRQTNEFLFDVFINIIRFYEILIALGTPLSLSEIWQKNSHCNYDEMTISAIYYN